MVSMAFGIVGIIACLCCKDVDYKMTNKVRIQFLAIEFALITCLTFDSPYTDRGLSRKHCPRREERVPLIDLP